MEDTVRIAVLSDSHGAMHPKVREMLAGCAYILHAGDIVRESDLDELGVYGRLYAVRGNCDRDAWACRLRDVQRFEIAGVRFVMVHDPKHVPRDLEGTDAVIFGHTHTYTEKTADGRLWLNPGSCGPVRFGGAPTMALLTVRGGKLTVGRIDLTE